MSKTNIQEKYQKLGIIGSGVFGDVYRAKYNNEYFAIKEIKKIKSNKNKFLKEIEVMRKMDCDNSVKLIESVETEESFYIISELCYITLAEYLNMKKKAFPVEELKELLIDLNKGLKVMYENKIIHGDIKPSNILLSSNNNNVNKLCFKISDFGLSKLYKENIISKSSIRVISQFISSECLKGKKIMIKVIYGLQVFLFIIFYFKTIVTMEQNMKL